MKISKILLKSCYDSNHGDGLNTAVNILDRDMTVMRLLLQP